jgi:uncharacterized protein DUF1629
MTIWEYTAINEYASVSFVEFLEHDLTKYFQGRLLTKWENIWVARSEECSEEEPMPDFVWHPGLFPIFSKKAVEILKPLINEYVQFLPLRWYPDEVYELYAVNVLTTRDFLDESKSVMQYRANGEVMNIRKYAFKEDCVVDVPIFKLPRYSNIVFVSDEFKILTEKEGLKGLNLRKMS